MSMSNIHAPCPSLFCGHCHEEEILDYVKGKVEVMTEKDDIVESLQSHCIHTQFQWSTRLLPIMSDPGSIPRGILM
jgi:hypothetical protein